MGAVPRPSQVENGEGVREALLCRMRGGALLAVAERAALLLELLPLAGDGHFDGALAASCGVALGTGAGGLDGV